MFDYVVDSHDQSTSSAVKDYAFGLICLRDKKDCPTVAQPTKPVALVSPVKKAFVVLIIGRELHEFLFYNSSMNIFLLDFVKFRLHGIFFISSR